MTAVDLLVTNVRPLGGARADVMVHDGRIAQVGPSLTAPGAGATIVDGAGSILLPAFVDAHMHLDKTFWGEPWRPHGAGPTVRDRIENERRVRRELSLRPDVQAARLVRQAVSRGTVHIRTHVDIDTEIGLANLEGVLAAREQVRAVATIQIVAFPQSGVVSRPGTRDLLDAGLRAGAELVGGIDPGSIDGDPAGQLDVIFGLAERHGAGIDIHLHDGGELGAFQIRLIAERTRALGLAGRVAISHAFALGMVDEAERERLIALLQEQRIAIMTNAPGDRAFPPVRRLREAGITVFSGSDGVRDAWTPFGTADMLERAFLLAYRSGFRTDEGLELALDIATRGGATVIGLQDYGVAIGCRASFVLVLGETPGELVVARPVRSLVVKDGVIVGRDGRCLG
jgi:cytosine/adenosine deaminase-related metal-dependent hydrolase